MNAPWRPALRYMGGKWRLAPEVLKYFPAHSTYVEPYGGAGSILLRKARSRGEIYNDLDRELVGFFRVLRDRRSAAELSRLVGLTPFSREEFELSYEVSADPIENARRFVVRCNFGVGATAVGRRRKTGFRAHSVLRTKSYAEDWARLPPALEAVTERLQGVVIECRPALQVMERADAPSTLIYADPPYMHATRSGKRIAGELEHSYVHEMTNGQHSELLTWLKGAKSMILLSGYRTDLYDAQLVEWRRIDIAARADQSRPRTESLWINQAAQAGMGALI